MIKERRNGTWTLEIEGVKLGTFESLEEATQEWNDYFQDRGITKEPEIKKLLNWKTVSNGILELSYPETKVRIDDITHYAINRFGYLLIKTTLGANYIISPDKWIMIRAIGMPDDFLKSIN